MVNHNLRAKLQRLRVPLGFITAVIFVFAARPSMISLVIGIPISLLGILVRGWASGHLRKNAELAVNGPYAHTRNPLYFGSFLMVVGCAVAGGVWLTGLWLILFFLMVYWPVMQAESEHMITLFADDYRTWAAAVPLFLPRLTPYKPSGKVSGGRGFDLQQYLRHREYRAMLGLAIVLAILILKVARIF